MEQQYPAIRMKRTEVYSNVKRTDGDEKTLLLGYIYTDDRNDVTHAQATDGWIKSAGKGEVVYIQPGHFVEEFADPDNILNQLILNAVNWRP
jgi:type 1 glutamine amidotransferase